MTDLCADLSRSRLMHGAMVFSLGLGLLAFAPISHAQDAAPDQTNLERDAAAPEAPSPSPSLDQIGTPQNAPTRLGPPVRLLPGQNGTPEPVPPSPSFGGGIMVENLDAADSDTVGLLDASNGGLGVFLWRGASRELTHGLLDQLPLEAKSPAMRSLMRRLLLSIAQTPAAPAPGSGETDPGKLLPKRAALLLDMGETESLLRLLDQAPPAARTEAVSMVRAQAYLVEGETDSACLETGAMRGRSTDPFWQKMGVICSLHQGDMGQATFQLDLLRETGSGDPAFFAGAEAALGLGGDAPESIEAPTPLHVAVWGLAENPLPAALLDSKSPVLARAVALSSKAPVETRVKAAEAAATYGVLTGEALAGLYGALDFSEAELAQPLASAEEKGRAQGRALLYRVIQSDKRPEAGAEAMSRGFALAQSEGVYGAAAGVFRPELVGMPKPRDIAWFAGQAAQALYRAGDAYSAGQWLALAQQNAFATPEIGRDAALLWPVQRMAEGSGGALWPPSALPEWRAALVQAGQSPGLAAARAAGLKTLFEAFGDGPGGAVDWASLALPQARVLASLPSTAVMRGLGSASDEGKVGMAVALALIALGDKGPEKATPDTMVAVVQALLTLNMEKEARALAAEAALSWSQ